MMKKKYIVIFFMLFLMLRYCGNDDTYFQYKEYRLKEPGNLYFSSFLPLVVDSTHIYMVGEYGGYPIPKKRYQAIVASEKNKLDSTYVVVDSIEGKIKGLTERGNFLYMITKEGNILKLYKINKYSGENILVLKESIPVVGGIWQVWQV